MKQLQQEGGYDSQEDACTALREVLHALRDRLPPEEVVDLAAQLPLVVRGIYYDGWKPAKTQIKLKNPSEFTEKVKENLAGKRPVDPEKSTKAVLNLLNKKVSKGEIYDLKANLPDSFAQLFC